MRCGGCQREIEVGDQYIEDTASGFLGKTADSSVDGFMAELFGGVGGKVIFCEDCTEPGGDYVFETFYGDEGES